MTPMADLFMNIDNETAYANRSTHGMNVDMSEVEQSDWYFQVSAATYFVRHETYRLCNVGRHIKSEMHNCNISLRRSRTV